VALMNASYTLGAPAVTSQQSFWRFAVRDVQSELGKAWHARKLAGERHWTVWNPLCSRSP